MTRLSCWLRLVVQVRFWGVATSFILSAPSLLPSWSSAAATSRLFAEGGDDSSSSRTWMESLKARQGELDREKVLKEQKWRNADCASGMRLALPDWVRRLDVDYPLVACGSSKGNIYVSNLDTGELVATNAPAAAAGEGDDDDDDDEQNYQRAPSGLNKALGLLFGSFDGGGTLAIAFAGDLICEAGRQGGVQVWRLDASSDRLVSQGSMKAQKDYVVTCLALDEEYLWVGTSDGDLHAYPIDATLPLALQSEPELEWKFSSTLLSLSLNADIGCGVVTTAMGGVEIVSLDDDSIAPCSFYPPMNPRPSDFRDDILAYPTSAIFAVRARDSTDGEDEVDDGSVTGESLRYSVVCGATDGSIWMHELGLTEHGELDRKNPFAGNLKELKPSHVGPVKCLANPLPGLLVSAGMDGSMRVWDIKDGESLYQFIGYKVWLGSLWTDGSRLVSDGSDNTVIMHDFEMPYDDGDV
jgi:WD40 repeat protein